MVVDCASACEIENWLFPKLSLRDKYKKLLLYYSSERYAIEHSQKCVAPSWHPEFPEYTKWLKWINVNICLHLGYDSITTIHIKLRIATGMLNKIEGLSHNEKIDLHLNLTRNINNVYGQIIDEELPF